MPPFGQKRGKCMLYVHMGTRQKVVRTKGKIVRFRNWMVITVDNIGHISSTGNTLLTLWPWRLKRSLPFSLYQIGLLRSQISCHDCMSVPPPITKSWLHHWTASDVKWWWTLVWQCTNHGVVPSHRQEFYVALYTNRSPVKSSHQYFHDRVTITSTFQQQRNNNGNSSPAGMSTRR